MIQMYIFNQMKLKKKWEEDIYTMIKCILS